MLRSAPSTDFGPVVAILHVSAITAAINGQNHPHKCFFFFKAHPDWVERKSPIQSYGTVPLSVDTEFHMASKLPLPPNSFPFLLFYSLLKQWQSTSGECLVQDRDQREEPMFGMPGASTHHTRQKSHWTLECAVTLGTFCSAFWTPDSSNSVFVILLFSEQRLCLTKTTKYTIKIMFPTATA